MSIYQAWSRALSGEFMYSAFHQIDEQKWVIAYCPAVSKRHVTTVWKLIDYALKDGVHNEINGLILQSLPHSARKAESLPTSSEGLGELLKGPAEAKESQLEPGQYFPRIWRGKFSKSGLADVISIDPLSLYGQAYINSMKGAIGVFEYLNDIFRYVEPSKVNKKSYGNKMREALILACTEIEANWVSIYRLNLPSSIPSNDRYSTTQYVCLKPIMKLDEWSVSLTHYEEMGVFQPFKNWQAHSPSGDSPGPTKSIPWYNAYNKIKHDRELYFHKANLENLLEAMAALYIMICAQWGPKAFEGRNLTETSFSVHSSPFRVESAPDYDLGTFYMQPFDFDGQDRSWEPISIEKYEQQIL